MIEEVDVDCPYCGARFGTLVDCSAGDQEYIEDCQVCCHPIAFEVYTDGEGGLIRLGLRRDDE